MTRIRDCARYIALQDRRLAEEEPLTPEEEAFLEEHASRCPSCRVEQETLADLRRAGEPAPEPAVSEFVVRSQVEQILAREATPRPASPAGRRWVVGLAASASVAAVVAALVLALPGGAGLQPQAPKVSAPPPSARIVGVSGEVTVAGRAARPGSPLVAGAALQVRDGEATVRLRDGSRVRVSPHSRLALLPSDTLDTVVRLYQGQALFRVAQQRPGRSFRVVTAWGRVRVVGTVFRVSAEAPRLVLVAAGEVEVRRPALPVQRVRGGQLLLANHEVRRLDDVTRRSLLRRAGVAAPPAAARPRPRLTVEPSPAKPPRVVSAPTRPAQVPRPRRPPTVPELEVPTVGQLLHHAARYRAARDWRAVIKVYLQLIRIHPTSSEAATSLVLIGQVQLRHLGQPASALRYFDAYLARHRTGGLAQEAAWGRIESLRRLGRRQAEIQACRALLQRHPGSVYAARVRAWLKALERRKP